MLLALSRASNLLYSIWIKTDLPAKRRWSPIGISYALVLVGEGTLDS